MADHIERAKILIEALPYIQQWYNKTIVVKYGGSVMRTRRFGRRYERYRTAVSGRNKSRSSPWRRSGNKPDAQKINKKSEFINGLRYTDEETMDIVQMVLCGKINKNLVAAINRTGGKAIGLCGLDGGMLKAEKMKENGFDYGLVGNIVDVNPAPVEHALQNGYIPVVSTVAQGVDGSTSYNVNADTAASKLAIAMGAEKLILLTDVMGLMRNPEDEATLLSVVKVSEIPGLIKDGVISGGMTPKVECCVEAIRRGVNRAHILDGRIPHSILIEVLSDEGLGTMIV